MSWMRKPSRCRGRGAARARCVTNAGVSGAPERRRIGTASATETSRRGVYSAVRRLFALLACDTRRESGATGADPCRLSFAHMSGKGHARMCPACTRMAAVTATHHRTGRTGHPLGLTAAKLLLSAPSMYAFSDHSPIVATFED